MEGTLYAVIPGGLWLTSQEIRAAFQRLEPSLVFAEIVGRPDSILLWSDCVATEDSVRRAVSETLDCPCVVVTAGTLERVVDDALDSVRALGHPTEPPYRVASEGAEWELCLVLSSDPLPPNADGRDWLFSRTRNAVAFKVLERRVLLAQKRRRTPRGGRVMLGTALIDPWERVLEAKGVTVACLTSRTLNRVTEVVAAARALRGSAPA